MPGWHSGSYGYHGHEGFLFARKVTPTANSEQYATFSSGDVVGCGVNFDRSRIFFTKNGKLLLDYSAEDIAGQLYPMIGFKGPGGEVYTNFRQNPFVFQDFDSI
ncbi:hypothetical protein P167DRAFT_63660 [Morchella conica CCBAS932]|uniref:B30.2/SPRY domain-containing protein n=2 Tax=Morchella sect. Distantes TaxID=1051054 RepID=A0A3N4KUU2_9PEZI|nr:hypothetical protein P167DRAFT_63660 [Morchella conica CCBAS932]